MRIFSNKERHALIALCEAKIAINKNYVLLRQKDDEVCKSIATFTGQDPAKIVNIEDILLELSKQQSISK